MLGLLYNYQLLSHIYLYICSIHLLMQVCECITNIENHEVFYQSVLKVEMAKFHMVTENNTKQPILFLKSIPYSYIFSYKNSQNRFYTSIIELLNPLSQKKEIRVDFKKSIPLIFCQDDFDWMFQLLVTGMIMCFFHLELSMEEISLWRILKDSLFQYYKYEN